MRRNVTLLLLTLAASVAATASADEVVKCESRGSRRRCGYESLGRVELKRQLSITACEEGQSWGYRDGEIWVDHGCRAEFSITPYRRDRDRDRDRDGGRYGDRQREEPFVVCESDGGRHRCNVDVPFGARLERQLSHRDCVEGRTWGYDSEGIWVRDGCRGEFVIEQRRRDRDRDDYDRDDRDRGRGRFRTIICESKDTRNHLCPVDTGLGVALTKQLSISDCTFRQSWGYNDRGIWVKDGCRAEFTVRTR
ncbi:MAG: DUF3011 domain-containing protein [Acidobacteriota bacterium]